MNKLEIPLINYCTNRGKDDEGCDKIIGSKFINKGICSKEEYKDKPFCACVNSSLPCPMLIDQKCKNSLYEKTGYLPVIMRKGIIFEICKAKSICVNDIDIEGNNNYVKGVIQKCGTTTVNSNSPASAPPSSIYPAETTTTNKTDSSLFPMSLIVLVGIVLGAISLFVIIKKVVK